MLDQAVEIAGRLGVAGLTIGSLATATGLSKSGLYAHFRSLEALQLAVLGQARERFVEPVLRPALAAPRGVPRIRTAFDHWVRLSMTVRLVACSSRRRPSSTTSPARSATSWSATASDLADSLAQMYRSGVKEGRSCATRWPPSSSPTTCTA